MNIARERKIRGHIRDNKFFWLLPGWYLTLIQN